MGHINHFTDGGSGIELARLVVQPNIRNRSQRLPHITLDGRALTTGCENDAEVVNAN